GVYGVRVAGPGAADVVRPQLPADDRTRACLSRRSARPSAGVGGAVRMTLPLPSTLDAARRYAAAGLCVLPAIREGDDKRVALRSWKSYQTRLPTPAEHARWFAGPARRDLCLVCGRVSGNLEMIDFDLAGVAFEPWRARVEAVCPGLIDRLVVETTPSGGRHVAYRCSDPVCGNMKLA